MGVDGPHQVFDRRFKFHGDDGFGDKLRRLWADDVDAENLTVVSVRDNLDEAFVLADNRRTRVRSEGELPDLQVVSGFAGSGFSKADAADFRMAIRRPGNVFGI